MLYVIAGDGTGNKTEIIASLEDLMAKAVESQAEFWFAIQPGEKNTTKYISQWMKDKEVYFATIGDTTIAGSTDELNPGADPDALIEFMQEYPDDEPEFLTLFVDVDDDVEDDAGLMAQVEAAVEAGFTVRQLNGQMTKLTFAPADAEEVEEETTGSAAVDDDDSTPEEPTEFTEADLKKMTVPELTALAKGQGLDVKSIGKAKPALITAILERQENPDEGQQELELDAALERDEDTPAPAKRNGKASAAATADPGFDAWIRKILGAVGSALVDASKS